MRAFRMSLDVRPRAPFLLMSLAVALGGAAARGQPAAPLPSTPAPRDWTTWGYDQERTGWNRGETSLGVNNVAGLKLQWSAQLSTPAVDTALSTLTAPVVAEGVPTPEGPRDMLFILGADDALFALDADSGRQLWRKTFPNPIQPVRKANWLCPNTANDTPVIDKAKGVVYFITSDGKLRGLALADGAERLRPTEMVAPFTRAWSLNLVKDVVYTSSGRACGEVVNPASAMAAAIPPAYKSLSGPQFAVPVDPSAVTAADVSDPAHPTVTRFYTSGGRPGAPWGRGGPVRGPNDTILVETSDGLYDPAAGEFGDSVLELAPKATRLFDSFTPVDHKHLAVKDFGGSANPVVFPFGGKMLAAVSNKQGVLYLLDTADLGGGPAENHATPLYKAPRLGNDEESPTDPGQGVWGSITTYLAPDGRRFLYVPMWGPPSKDVGAFKLSAGPTPHGSIMAFEVTGAGDKPVLVPQWISPDLIMPDPPVVANGVVYATQTGGQALQNIHTPDGKRQSVDARFRSTPISNLVLYAFDAESGRQLYSSGKTIADWVHFSEPVVALGKVFLVTHDAHVYAFTAGR